MDRLGQIGLLKTGSCSRQLAYFGEGGFGLFNIRERMAALGGKLEVLPGRGGGTCVTATVPAPRADDGSSPVSTSKTPLR